MKIKNKLSKCCNSSVTVSTADEGTAFYICNECSRGCDVVWNKSALGSLSEFVDEMHKNREERCRKLYPTGIIPICEEEMWYHQKSIEEKIEMIHAKLNEVIDYLNSNKL